MSLVALRPASEGPDTLDGSPRSSLRWTACFVVIAGLHFGLAWFALHWVQHTAPVPSPPPTAVMIDLAPLPAALPAPLSEIAPGPSQTVSQPSALEPEIQHPLPNAPSSPAPKIAVPVPPKPKPAEHRRLKQDRPPPERAPDETPPAPATTAPPQFQAPPAAAAAPAPSVRSEPSNAVPTWQGRLLGRLEEFKRYPALAQMRRQQGVAYLRFVMDREGNVLSARIERTSGYELLDQETLALIQRVQPLPKPPPGVPGGRIELVVPVVFSLRGQN